MRPTERLFSQHRLHSFPAGQGGLVQEVTDSLYDLPAQAAAPGNVLAEIFSKMSKIKVEYHEHYYFLTKNQITTTKYVIPVEPTGHPPFASKKSHANVATLASLTEQTEVDEALLLERLQAHVHSLTLDVRGLRERISRVLDIVDKSERRRSDG